MLIYALKSAIVLSLLYLPYLLMLRRESFFRFNRAVLCGILLCSLVLPLCNLPALSLDENPVVNAAQQQMIEVGIPIAQGIVPGDAASVDDLPRTSWWGLVATLYIIVAIMLLALRLHDYLRLRRIIAADCLWQRRAEGGITIYCHRGDVPAFSWYKSIVLSASDYEQNGPCIIRHETGHILCGHSWDIMLLTLVQLVQWFNPLVWVLGQSLQDVHEYEADDYVLRGGITLDEYRYLLIQKAVGASPYVFANNFNHSQLKNRIKMMYKKKSSPWQRGKALYFIPVALVALSAFATPEFKQASESATAFYDGKGKDGVEVIKTTQQTATTPDDRVYDTCDELPTYPGGNDAMMGFVASNMRYPREAQEWGEQGKILVQFIVEKDGTLSSFKAFDGKEELEGRTPEITVNAYAPDGRKLTAEEVAAQTEACKAARQALKDEAVRVIKLMPKWTPGKQKGEAVRVKMLLPFTFFRLS